MSLTDRIRPNVEAAPWVIAEIKKREEVTAALVDELTRQKTENAKLREALTNLIDACDGNYAELVAECRAVLKC